MYESFKNGSYTVLTYVIIYNYKYNYMNLDKITDRHITSGLDCGGVFSNKEYKSCSIKDRIKLINDSIENTSFFIEMQEQEIAHLKEIKTTKNMCDVFAKEGRQNFTYLDKIKLIESSIGQYKELLNDFIKEINYLNQKYLEL